MYVTQFIALKNNNSNNNYDSDVLHNSYTNYNLEWRQKLSQVSNWINEFDPFNFIGSSYIYSLVTSLLYSRKIMKYSMRIHHKM